MKILRKSCNILLPASIIILAMGCTSKPGKSVEQKEPVAKTDSASAKTEWHAPDTNSIPATTEGELIRYGRSLIANTAYYLGPKGTVTHISNGMNCQNCHADAGAKPYGNCFSAVASTYPVFRPRSGIVESIEFRINDCLQ